MPRVAIPTTIDEAVALLAERDATPLAGGTWTMRAPVHGKTLMGTHVLVEHLAELREIRPDRERWLVGAAATHDALAALPHDGPTGCLAQAAAKSAFPAIRSVATLGGNLGARGFAQADLVPALLAADAVLRLRDAEGVRAMAVADYLAGPPRPGELIVAAELPAGPATSSTSALPAGPATSSTSELPAGPATSSTSALSPAPATRSTYERLTVRGGGEYAIAAVALSVDLDGARRVARARVAFGSVEREPRRCPPAEEALADGALDDDAVERAERAALGFLDVREDAAASAAYRATLAAVALRRAAQRLRREIVDAA